MRVRPFSAREAPLVTAVDENPFLYGEGSLSQAAPTQKSQGKSVRKIIRVIDQHVLIFDPADENPLMRFQKTLLPAGKRVKDMRYAFDHIFDEESTQEEVIYTFYYLSLYIIIFNSLNLTP